MAQWFDKGKKIIVFGTHRKSDIFAEKLDTVECSLCGFNMFINIGMYPAEKDNKVEFNVAPPKKYDLAFAKECFTDLAVILLQASGTSRKYLKNS